VESIAFFSNKELEKAGIERRMLDNSNYVKARGILENGEYFDASFFGYSPREAEIMDPQVRIFHECVWEAVEDAGYNLESYKGTIGLYAGASSNLLWEGLTLLSGKHTELGDFAARHLIEKDFLSTRISFNLNLRGPSFSIYTACSTSLVAIHQASRALLSGECKMALAGGVSLGGASKSGYLYQEGMVSSADGHCRAFDTAANGTVSGDGVGIVLLKRLKEAEADRDNIHALIKGSSVNNDGNIKAGFTAPGIQGQAAVIKTAQLIARVEPGSIGYIETHGTGTNLGDPVEIESLKTVFKTNKKRSCAIGSVKTNIGHLDTAAGAAGFIKAVLALKHKQLPPTLHFENPNPKIDFENSPFYVVNRLTQWKNNGYPLRAGVSSFGIGGTNAHVILEEAPKGTGGLAPMAVRDHQLILLSAKTPSALEQISTSLAEHLKRNPKINLADVAYTLQVGRKHFKHRKMLVCTKDVDEAVNSLSSNNSPGSLLLLPADENRPVIFMFPGLGSQYVNMGRELYQNEPLFREEMDRCFEILKPLTDYDIKEILYPEDSVNLNRSNRSNMSYNTHMSYINQIQIAQIMILIFEYSLAKLFIKWGIKPQAMIGYSFGEYTAACLSGVFSLEDALDIIVSRGKLIETVPNGGMLSVPLPLEELKSLLNGNLSIAVDNGSSCIVSGPGEEIDAFEQYMKEKRYLCMRLQSSHAIHSRMMEPILKDFQHLVGKIQLNKPQIPYISNVTGNWLTPGKAPEPGYWSKHLRETVRFADGIQELIKKENAIFIELGPGRDLSALLRRYVDKNSNRKIVDTVRPGEKEISDIYYLLNKIGQLWLYGVEIDWQEFYRGEKRHRISLPTYPFQGQRFWIDTDSVDTGVKNVTRQLLSTGKSTMEDWFYIPSWERSLLMPWDNANRIIGKGLKGLVFLDECGVGSMLVERMKQEGYDIVTVTVAKEFKKPGGKQYSINPRKSSDYETLIDELNRSDFTPNRIVHLWGIDKNEHPAMTIRELLDLGFYSILYLAKAMLRKESDGVVEINMVTIQMQEVTGEENLCPGKAAVIGPVLVIPQEHPRFFCRSLDIILPESGSFREKRVVEQLQAELSSGSRDRIIAFRGNQRLVRVFNPIPRGEIQEDVLPLRERGNYLITGGLGKIGLIIAEYLARRFRARLILTGRSEFPVRGEWEQWLTSHDEKDSISVKIRKLQQWEAVGARVMVLRADAADPGQMKRAIGAAEEQLGKINGVIHAAGLVKDETFQVIEKLEKSHCEQQFQAKVYGLVNLENLFQDKELDFCLLISSLSTVLGGLQFTAYAAANAFMDAFVTQHNQLNKNNWLSVNWEMPEKETHSDFKRILALSSGSLNQVVVDRGGDLQEKIDKWVKFETLGEDDDSSDNDLAASYSRPELLNPYVPPQTQIEREVAGIFQELFGFEQIGVQDDFFQLGGDSLKAITVISRIHKTLHVEIPLTEFFKRPTIQQLAQYIEQAEKSIYSSIDPVEKKELSCS
jgi:acyl transferase domain-containing protein/acyl carrier protein